MRETTALGAAIAAGLAIGVWRNFAELRDINRAGGTVFEPQVSRQESTDKFEEWERAVQMSRGWVKSDEGNDFGAIKSYHPKSNHGNVPPSLTIGDGDLSVISNVVKGPIVTDTTKRTTQISVKEIGVHPVPKPLVTVIADLDEMDEEELVFELRKVEILKRLKKLKRLDYY